ncbi:hypothetical protein D6D02_06715 [Aureobasidium pullulans]|nr:hypothetical protein D6D02_06715 [Aureobasidium pullulans]
MWYGLAVLLREEDSSGSYVLHPCHLKCIYLELYQAKYHDVQCYTKEFDDYFILEHFAKHDIDDEQSYQIEQDDRLNQDYQIEQDDRLNQDYQIK